MTPKTLMLALTLAAFAPIADAQHGAGLLTNMGLDDYSISYLDISGEPLTQEQFMAKVMANNGFRTTKDKEAKTAVLQITSLDAAKLAAIQARAAGLSPAATTKLETGANVPDVVGRDLTGTPLTLPTRGDRPTLLSFHFSACAPCIKEVPDLNAFRSQHPEIELIAVTFDPVAEAQEFNRKWGLELTTVADAQEYIDQLGVKQYPTLMLLDRDGKLVASKVGGIITSNSDRSGLAILEAWLQQAMAGAAQSSAQSLPSQ